MIKKVLSLSTYKFSRTIEHIPNLQQFMSNNNALQDPQIQTIVGKKYYIETYGCQMNENDSQIISSILQQSGYQKIQDEKDAHVILLNTCAIRANAENKVLTRLSGLQNLKKDNPDLLIGLLGCMAERLKKELWKKGVDVVVGPDGYRNLPELLNNAKLTKQVDVQLSWEETYEDFLPLVEDGTKTTFVSIMRGCNNMCSFCIVPFTRGRERSRSPTSILKEIELLWDKGVREITLLGQNVNSYFYRDESVESDHQNAEGFKELYKLRSGNGLRFSQLLEQVAESVPNMRIRFTSPHPKDFSDSVLQTIHKYPNIARNIHVPSQSGSSSMLERMRRNYSRDSLISLCDKIRIALPGVTLTTDIIVGFCDETQQEYQDTLSLMQNVKFELAYMFAYSMRERTHAHRNFQDSITPEIKQSRLVQLIDSVHSYQLDQNKEEVGRLHLVLIDSLGKKEGQLKGRTDTNKFVIVQQDSLPDLGSSLQTIISLKTQDKISKKKAIIDTMKDNDEIKGNIQMGDFIVVLVEKTSLKTLFGIPICKASIQEFARVSQNRPYIDL